MNRLSLEKRVLMLKLLCEGNSTRGIARIVECSPTTVAKFVADLGKVCAEFMHNNMQNIPCRHIEVDEIWSFVYAKDKRLPDELRDKDDIGSIWTWIGICRDTKLIPCWHTGGRQTEDAKLYFQDLASRVNHKISVYSDGHKPYVAAVKEVFGTDVNYGRYVKLTEKGKFVGSERHVVIGDFEPKKIGTTYIERHNLMLRTTQRRFMRKTNGHSKTFENHCYS